MTLSAPGRAEGASEPSALAPALTAGAVSGFAVLVAEIGVVRMCAPWFGQGTHAFANAIAVVLLALAAGYGLGARLARAEAGWGAVATLLGLAALGLCAAAVAGPSLARALAPESVSPDRPHPLSLAGSLAAAAILAGPPCVLLGAAGTVLVALSSAGPRAASGPGLVSAATTLGGLLGCGTASSVLVPLAGSRGAFLLAAGALALVGIAVGRRAERPVGRAAPEGPDDRPAIGRLRELAAAAIALLAGTLLTVVELGTVRALAPAFGTDAGTYVLGIGTILVAAAAGAALGRRAVGGLPAVGAAAALLATGLGALSRIGGAPVLCAAIPGFAAIALAAVPIALVGALARGAGTETGRCAGRIFAASTVGNVAGCWLAPLALLPSLGVRTTFLLSAAGALAAIVGAARLCGPVRRSVSPAPEPVRPATDGGSAARTRPRRGPLVVACLGAGAALGSVSLVGGPLRADPGQVDEVESAYQTIRVVDRTETVPTPGASPLDGAYAALRARFLGFDEDRGSYQSVRLLEREDAVLTGGRYYEHLALGAWFDGQPWTRPAPAAPRVLVIGYCGGTLHRVLELAGLAGHPAEVTGVEIDPAVVEVAKERLGAFPSPLDLRVGRDGRAVLRDLPPSARFDLIVVDAYQRTQYIPFHLTTVEFFRECAARLAPDGAIGINVFAPNGAAGRLVRCLGETLQAATGRDAWLAPNARYPGNVAIWGGCARVPRLSSRTDGRLALAAFQFDRLLIRHVPGAGDATVLTDDHAPTERIADEDLLATEEPR